MYLPRLSYGYIIRLTRRRCLNRNCGGLVNDRSRRWSRLWDRALIYFVPRCRYPSVVTLHCMHTIVADETNPKRRGEGGLL